MIIERTFDIDLIKSVMFIDEIWDSVVEDGYKKEHYEPNLQTVIWLSIKENDKVIALGSLDIINKVTLSGHPLVIPEYRGDSLRIMNCVFNWFISEDHSYIKLIAEVPSLFKKVMSFAERAGFNYEGTRTDSYMKNGAIYDVNLYGITKSELKERFQNAKRK